DWNVKFDDNASQSGFSQTTYAPTLMSGGHITIPAPPRSSLGGAPFECPYCYFIIVASSTRSWHGHVFQDLQPYICLEQTCSTPQKLYTTRHEWVHHINTIHRSEDFLVAKTDEQEKGWSCILCEEPQKTRQQYDRHIARHLQELALFVLPRNDEESADDESDDDEPATKSESEGCYFNEIWACCRCDKMFWGSGRCEVCLHTACRRCLRRYSGGVELRSPASIEASDDDGPSPTNQEGREDLGKTGDDKEKTALEQEDGKDSYPQNPRSLSKSLPQFTDQFHKNQDVHLTGARGFSGPFKVDEVKMDDQPARQGVTVELITSFFDMFYLVVPTSLVEPTRALTEKREQKPSSEEPGNEKQIMKSLDKRLVVPSHISPSSERSLSPDRMSSLPRHRRGRQKTQQSQGHPSLSKDFDDIRLGDVVVGAAPEPLQSTSPPEAGELGKDTDGKGTHRTIQIAQDALSAENNEDKTVLQRGRHD
ncbi:MAG: hypothetical protein Q9192_008445, partial [Flavoplaca navasiana]